MIEALKDEVIIQKAGGRFMLCALIQKRLKEYLDGARPLVERNGRSDLELIVEEILQDKIVLVEGESVEEPKVSHTSAPAANALL